jgi:hypothetical protein
MADFAKIKNNSNEATSGVASAIDRMPQFCDVFAPSTANIDEQEQPTQKF